MKRQAKATMEFSMILILVGIVCLFSFIRLGHTTRDLIENLSAQNNNESTKAPKVTGSEVQAIETSGAAAYIANAQSPQEAFERISQMMALLPPNSSYDEVLALVSSVPNYEKPSGLTDKTGGIPPCSYCYYDDYTVGSLNSDGKLVSVQRLNPTLGDQGNKIFIDPVNISYEPYFSTNDPVPFIDYTVYRGASTYQTYISYYDPLSSNSISPVTLPTSITPEQQQVITSKIVALVLSKK